MRRVVVTGMAGVTSLGEDWPTIRGAFEDGHTGIRYMEDWERFTGINTRLAAPVRDFSVEDRFPRKKLRTMGRVAQLAVYATEQALIDAGLLGDAVIGSGRTGVAYGSSFGSPDAVLGFFELKKNGISRHLNATSYIQMMGHTTAVNIGMFFGATGRIIPTSSACTSGSQGIGYAFEAIRWNRADVMIAGGAEELDITDSAVFDTLYATSTKNDQPHRSPRPFDRDRDGLVIGEGAGTLILEEYERARARGATIYAEIAGFGCNSDGNHITQPQASTMQVAGSPSQIRSCGSTPAARTRSISAIASAWRADLAWSTRWKKRPPGSRRRPGSIPWTIRSGTRFCCASPMATCSAAADTAPNSVPSTIGPVAGGWAWPEMAAAAGC